MPPLKRSSSRDRSSQLEVLAIYSFYERGPKGPGKTGGSDGDTEEFLRKTRCPNWHNEVWQCPGGFLPAYDLPVEIQCSALWAVESLSSILRMRISCVIVWRDQRQGNQREAGWMTEDRDTGVEIRRMEG